ncbi:hypothetical protein [Chryseobacterium lathyri]|uniref:hypothetical protein n=1 Tax=Chryseobacterium lathyri TaxID=395933 RepID=UPI001CC08BCE|nr:hypothetical protein [Chryseobacterium lathyri]
MKNVQEYRIGNLVTGIWEDLETDEQYKGLCRITGIDENGALGEGWHYMLENLYIPRVESYCGSEPIELTEEWLLKFGFEIEKSNSHCIAFNENYEHELQLDKEFETKENCWNITKYGGGYRLIYYVHQLQNLYFALTGEELTIKE